MIKIVTKHIFSLLQLRRIMDIIGIQYNENYIVCLYNKKRTLKFMYMTKAIQYNKYYLIWLSLFLLVDFCLPFIYVVYSFSYHF